MSLLLVNAGNRLAQGFLRNLYASGKYEKIVCADYYPNYASVERLLKFREQLDQYQVPTQLEIKKLADRQDLLDLAKENNNLLYVSHDYYRVAPSKLRLLDATLSFLKGRNYQFVSYVAPVELDHQGETQTWRQLEAEHRDHLPQLTGLRSDVTFGTQSVVSNAVLQSVLFGKSLYFKPLGASPAPLYAGDLASIVEKVMTAQECQGKSYVAAGPKHYDWNSYVKVLEKATGTSNQARLNANAWENVIQPTNANLLSELLYTPEYMNLTQLIANYRALPSDGAVNASTLVDSLTDFEAHYKENPVVQENVEPVADLVTQVIG